MLTIVLLTQPYFIPSYMPPSTPPIVPVPSNREWYEVLLEPSVLIPLLIVIVVSIFLFIYVFKYCNKERSESFKNVIDSISVAASKIKSIFSKKEQAPEKSNVIHVNVTEKKVQTVPSLKIK